MAKSTRAGDRAEAVGELGFIAAGHDLAAFLTREQGLAGGRAIAILEGLDGSSGWRSWAGGRGQWRAGFSVPGLSEPGCSENPLPASAVYTADRPHAVQCNVIFP